MQNNFLNKWLRGGRYTHLSCVRCLWLVTQNPTHSLSNLGHAYLEREKIIGELGPFYILIFLFANFGSWHCVAASLTDETSESGFQLESFRIFLLLVFLQKIYFKYQYLFEILIVKQYDNVYNRLMTSWKIQPIRN